MMPRSSRQTVYIWSPYPWPGCYERQEGTLVELGHGFIGVAVKSPMARYGWSVYDLKTGLEISGPGSGSNYQGPLKKDEAIEKARHFVAAHHEAMEKHQIAHLAKYGPPPSVLAKPIEG